MTQRSGRELRQVAAFSWLAGFPAPTTRTRASAFAATPDSPQPQPSRNASQAATPARQQRQPRCCWRSPLLALTAAALAAPAFAAPGVRCCGPGCRGAGCSWRSLLRHWLSGAAVPAGLLRRSAASTLGCSRRSPLPAFAAAAFAAPASRGALRSFDPFYPLWLYSSAGPHPPARTTDPLGRKSWCLSLRPKGSASRNRHLGSAAGRATGPRLASPSAPNQPAR